MNQSVEKSNARRQVTAVGDSWIVGKSKSHPGFTYYFNTLTGEAVWNLSAAEIEKAKNSTKRLEKLQGGKPIKCPEPKDKPPSTALNNSRKPLPSPSEKILINSFSEQQSSVLTYSNMINSNGNYHTPFSQISGVMQGAQINLPLMEPACDFNSFNSSLNTYNLNATPMVYNPKVWALPHTQQVFIAPAVASVVNHSLGPQNVALSQSVGQPATGLVYNSFENANQSSIITSHTETFYPGEYIHDQGVQQTTKKNNDALRNKNDLRQKLLFMKSKFNNKSSMPPRGSGLLKPNINPRKANISAHIVNQVEGNHSNDLGNGMDCRCEEKKHHETPSKIDLESLKCLAPPDSNSDAWYIVVDLEVLLHEFKFLTMLTDSDDKCHLMVPKRVMEELKVFVNNYSENIQAKRILRFLSQQIEIGIAHLAKEPSQLEDDSMEAAIHATCKELLDKKYHLILLSNNGEIMSKCSNVNVFCIEEVKNFLMENSNKQMVSPGPKKSFMTNELINKIKIVVPNNVSHNTDGNSPVSDVQHGSPLHVGNVSKPPESTTVLKRTVDAGIQTDLEEINASSLSLEQKQPSNAASYNFPQNTKETMKMPCVSSVSNVPDKKREIILKRSISHQSAVNSVESDKKKFKWRRKRNMSQGNEEINPANLSSSDQHMNTNSLESQKSNTLRHEISELPDRTLNSNPIIILNENKSLDDSIESRESSICAGPNSTTEPNVTIEETSTSGIISNSESNVDADSTFSNSNYSINNGATSPVMFEVDSITMEQYLRTKCDEWISRFIQIMEEVLSQVLQQEPKFIHKAMPPPWTLHEAAQCITVKFRGHHSITAAANKLSDILFQVSDAQGKIIMNMDPLQYMQMYSYGVHLLDEIMEVTCSEDIQIAMKSLNKLLFDIKNPNMESNTNDAFIEDNLEDISNNAVSVYSGALSNCGDDEASLHEQEMLPGCSSTVEPRNNEPEENISYGEEIHRGDSLVVKFIRKIDIPFPQNKSLFRQRNSPLILLKPPVEYDVVSTWQPKIIRTFQILPKFEEKLKYNSYAKHHNAIGNHADSISQVNTTMPDVPVSVNNGDTHLRAENNKMFKYMMFTLLHEIKSALSQVQAMCHNYYEKLRDPEQSPTQKYQLQKSAEQAHLHTLRLCRSLESMLDHEEHNPAHSMSALLEQAGIDIRHLDADLLIEYRITVEKCKEVADEFLSSLQNIISDVKR